MFNTYVLEMTGLQVVGLYFTIQAIRVVLATIANILLMLFKAPR